MNTATTHLPNPIRLVAGLRRCTAGSALIEAAMAAPLMVMLAIGTVETSRFVYANMTVQSVATGAAEELSRDHEIDVPRMADFLAGAGGLAAPFDLDAGGAVVVSVVEGRADGPPEVIWQARDSRPRAAASRIGSAGGPATLPPGFSLSPGETVAIAEVFFGLQPMFGTEGMFGEIYKTAVLRPRVGELHLPE